jgi:lipopolysaccharide transport system ATP-binding protein
LLTLSNTMEPIIRISGVSKRYHVGQGKKYGSLRESLVEKLKAPFRSRDQTNCESHFWALRNVDLEVQPGEILGLIGDNGAGKSTLLKILSRITRPTTGRVELHGRVGSLLEVGTGFHPELTGRDNIFLNGSILGMRRAEIVNRFDEIVDFSGVEKFIDTPVKRYSSGMYVRLAFAVAAHLQPEIMLIDEVLAVGDAEFQKKCLGKMGDVARAGRTVVFISHNMAAIEALCGSCVQLKGGTIIAHGPTSDVIARYMASIVHPGSGSVSLLNHPGRTGSSLPTMLSVSLAADGVEPVSIVRMGGRLTIKVAFASERPVTPVMGIVVKNSHGVAIFGVNNKFIGGYRFEGPTTAGIISCTLDDLSLMPGCYSLDLYFGDGPHDIDVVIDGISVEVLPADVFGTGQLPPSVSGVIFRPASFELDEDCSAISPGSKDQKKGPESQTQAIQYSEIEKYIPPLVE